MDHDIVHYIEISAHPQSSQEIRAEALTILDHFMTSNVEDEINFYNNQSSNLENINYNQHGFNSFNQNYTNPCYEWAQRVIHERICLDITGQTLDVYNQSNNVNNVGPPTATVTLYALRCLSYTLDKCWNSWSEDKRMCIRDEILNYMTYPENSQGNGHRPSCERYVKEKIAAILSDVAERIYPQLWSTFLDDMQKVSGVGSLYSTEIVIRTLKTISEDCVDGDFNSKLPTKRRTQILKTFSVELPPLTPVFLQTLVEHYQTKNESGVRIVQAIVELFGSLANHLNIHTLLYLESNQIENNTKKDPILLQTLFQLALEHPIYSLQAIDVLKTILTRKCDNNLQREAFLSILQQGLQSLITEGREIWECIEYCDIVANLINTFLTQNLSILIDNERRYLDVNTDQGTTLHLFFQQIAHLFTNLPFYRSCNTLIFAFNTIFKEKKLSYASLLHQANNTNSNQVNFPIMIDLVPVILDQAINNCVKLHYDVDEGVFESDEVSGQPNLKAQEEFLDVEEHLNLNGIIRGSTVLLCNEIAKQYPLQSLLFLKEKVNTIFTKYGTAAKSSNNALDGDMVPLNYLDAAGRVTVESSVYLFI